MSAVQVNESLALGGDSEHRDRSPRPWGRVLHGEEKALLDHRVEPPPDVVPMSLGVQAEPDDPVIIQHVSCLDGREPSRAEPLEEPTGRFNVTTMG